MPGPTATIRAELYRVNLVLTDGPSITDAFGEKATITGVALTFGDRKPTAIRFESAMGDVFIDSMELENPAAWPEWLRDLVEEHQPNALT